MLHETFQVAFLQDTGDVRIKGLKKETKKRLQAKRGTMSKNYLVISDKMRLFSNLRQNAW